MFLVNVLMLLALASSYIGWRLLPALPGGDAVRILGIGVLGVPVVLAGATLLARRFASARLARVYSWAGGLTLGWVSWLLFATLARELVLAAARLSLSGPQLTLWNGDSAIGAVFAALGACLVGLPLALRPRLREVVIPLSGLPPALQGFTIVQLSDVHVGRTLRRRFVSRLVERVNALEPDLIAITGDLVDGSVQELAASVAPLAQLRARHGCFFVTGNHEYYSGAASWIAHLRRLGLHVLLNEHVVLRHGTAGLVLAGVTDPVAQAFDASQRSDARAALHGAPAHLRPRVLLAHRPRSAPRAAEAGFDLQLCGHTHGGQFWPWNWVVRYQEPLRTGLDRLGQLWVYTSPGTGFWGPPQRLGTRGEITRLRLVAAQALSEAADRAGDTMARALGSG